MEVIYIKYKERFLQKDYKILKEKRDFDSEKFLSFLEEKEYFEKPASIYYLNKDLELNIPYDTLIIEGLFHDLDKCFSYTKNRQKTLTTGKENYLKSLYEKNLSLATKYNIDEELKYSNDDASVLIDWFQKGNDVKPDLSVWNYNNEKDLPIGHAELSIIKLQEFFKLKEREILSIRYHMSVFEPGLLDNRSKMNLLNRATELYPDIKALQLADQKATFKEDWQEKKQ
jgi:hypothetical protein